MKKRLLSELLVTAVAIGMIAGCGKEEATVDKVDANPPVENEEKDEGNKEKNFKQDVEVKEADNTMSIVMVGDMLLHTPVEQVSLVDSTGIYDYEPIFANTRELIESADLAIANQEVIIGGEELGVSGYPAFNAPYAFGDELVDVGFDVVCHGTNHALDKGKKGIVNCLNFWNENYPQMGVVGIHDSEEDQDEIYVYECNDIKVAILNYTYGTNGIEMPKDMPFAVDYLDEERVASDLKRAEEMADFTIVCPHWGTEYRLEPDSMQAKWTKLFVAGGADLILGTHPHVIEPIEWVKDEESGNEALVYYSLGNFVNWTSGTGEGTSNRMVGGMAEVTLVKDEFKGVQISEYGVIPLVCHVTGKTGGVTVYPMYEYSDELGQQNEIKNQDWDFSFEYCENLAKSVFGENIR